MKNKVYQALVNRHNGICQRYHHAHDGTTGIKRIWSWVYLILLNLGYYVLFMHFLGQPEEMKMYEEKALNTRQSESEEKTIDLKEHVEELIHNYDIIL